MTAPLSSFGKKLPSDDTLALLALVPSLNTVNFLDGPSNISHAPTTPTTNSKPSLAEMMYYNYYTAAMYCQYELDDLSCDYCNKFKKDVYYHTGETWCNAIQYGNFDLII